MEGKAGNAAKMKKGIGWVQQGTKDLRMDMHDTKVCLKYDDEMLG